MFQTLRHSNTCNQVKRCTKPGRPNQSQRELTLAFTDTVKKDDKMAAKETFIVFVTGPDASSNSNRLFHLFVLHKTC